MIYLNNELYKLDTDKSYLELKEYCDTLGYPIILKRNPSFTKKIKKVGKGSGFKTHMPPKFFDYNHTERSAGGSKAWRYSLLPVKKDREGYPEYEGDHGEFLSSLTITFGEYDLEKLWFLITKSNMIHGREVYFVHDPEKDYRERVKNDSNAIGVKFYIMSEHSPLSAQQLIVIAKYFGIPMAGSMSSDKLKTVLFDKIESLERSKKKGYENFMNATKIDKLVAFKASLQDAIDQGIVGWIPRSLQWSWLDSSGKPITNICQLNSADEKSKMDVLMDFLLASDELTDRLHRELGFERNEDSLVFEAFKLGNDKEDTKYSYDELKELCGPIPGFSPVAKGTKVIIDEIKKFHNIV